MYVRCQDCANDTQPEHTSLANLCAARLYYLEHKGKAFLGCDLTFGCRLFLSFPGLSLPPRLIIGSQDKHFRRDRRIRKERTRHPLSASFFHCFGSGRERNEAGDLRCDFLIRFIRILQ